MDKFLITGGTQLSGELPVSGSKNSALPALAACLLTNESVVLSRVPQVKDILTMEKCWGMRARESAIRPGRCTYRRRSLDQPEAPYEIVKTMRASSLVLGPMVARDRACTCFDAGRMRDRGAADQFACLGTGAAGRAD